MLCAVALLAAGCGNGLAGATAPAELISADEARLPALPRMVSRGGITRGPEIRFVSPLPDGRVKAPFDLRVDIRAHGGSRIDPSTVKVTYLREPLVDLTPRLAGGISEAGIRQAGVSVPPGTHDLEVEVTDVDGRTRSDTVTFTVAE
jgi:hypothetical protein